MDMKRSLACVVLLACGEKWSDSDVQIGERFRSSPALRTYGSCGELGDALRMNLKEELRVSLLQSVAGRGYESPVLAGDAEADGAAAAPRQEGVDFSGTNNQEAGVDEADFVKTDGYAIYVLNGDRLEIFDVPEFGQLAPRDSVTLEGTPTAMLLFHGRVAVFSSIYTWNLPVEHPLRPVIAQAVNGSDWYNTPTFVKLTVVDTSATPALVTRQIYLEGDYLAGRRVDSTVRLVSYATLSIPGVQYYPDLPNAYWRLDEKERKQVIDEAVARAIAKNDSIIDATELDALVPKIYERQSDYIFPHPFTARGCTNFAAAEDATARGVTSILSLDFDGPSLAFDADHLVTNRPTVYSSSDTMLIAEVAQEPWWYWKNDDFQEATNLHRFDVSGAARSVYTGRGRVDGTVLGQFALSEHEGLVRVASTTGQWGRWWVPTPPEPENHVFVLGGDNELSVLGHLGGIAVGERLWSARFVGDKAFLVTFRYIDPLWTIDLHEPTAPKIAGELEVPGVSTYIHPIADNRLLTIGFGGTDTGLDWSTALSLFNVGDFSSPQLDDALTLAPPAGDGWSYAFSEANYEHKAFQFWQPLGLLAVPLSTYRTSQIMDSWAYEYRSRLQLVQVDPQGQLSAYGEIDHSSFYNSAPETYWSYRDIRRSIFMGDFIYAISDRGITAHRLSDLSLTASAPLPGTTAPAYGYFEGDVAAD